MPKTASLDKFSSWQNSAANLSSFRQQSLQLSTYNHNVAGSALAKARRWEQSLSLVAGLQDVASHNLAISCAATQNRWAEAVDCFACLQQQSIRSTVVTYGAVVAACEGLWEICLCLLTECGQRFEAAAVGNMGSNAFCNAGKWNLAIEIIAGVILQRIQIDGPSYTACIKACGSVTSWQRSGQLFSSLRAVGPVHVSAHNEMMSSCGKQWQMALDIFAQEPQLLDDVSHRTAMNVCEKASQWQQALLLFPPLKASGHWHPRNTAAHNAAINACKSADQWNLAVALLVAVRQRRQADVISYGATVSACAKAFGWRTCFGLLDSFRLADQQTTGVFEKKMELGVPLSAALGACEAEGLWEAALDLLRELQQHFRIDSLAYQAAIAACGKGLRWQIALELYGELQPPKMTPDIRSLNVALAACVGSAQWQQTLFLLAESFDRANLRLDAVSFNTAINSVVAGGNWRIAIDLLEKFTRFQLQQDVIGFCGAATACVRGGGWELAILLLESLSHTMCKNIISMNCAITACHQGALWQDALFQYQNLSQPSVVSCNAAISACGEISKWIEPVSLLGEAKQRTIEIDTVTYNASIDASRAHWHRVIELLGQLKQIGSVSSWCYLAVISTCAMCTHWSRALFLLNEAEEEHGDMPDAYEAVLGAFLIVARWQESAFLLARLQKSQVEGNAPCYKAAIDVFEKSGHLQQKATALTKMQLEMQSVLGDAGRAAKRGSVV